MISRENSGPFLRDLSCGSAVKIQLDFLLNKIKDAKEKWKVNLNEQEGKANAIWKEFQESDDEQGENRALSALKVVALETGRITALGKVEHLFLDIELTAEQALKFSLDLGKIVEVARHCLQDCREVIPSLTQEQVAFKEHATTVTMTTLKNEIHKKLAVKNLEKIVLEYQDHITDREKAKVLFEEYAGKLNRLNRTNRPVAITLRDKVIEDFREALEFSIPALAESRSKHNKDIALQRMKELLILNPEIKDDPNVMKLLESYTQQLNSRGLKRALECEQLVKNFYAEVQKLYN